MTCFGSDGLVSVNAAEHYVFIFSVKFFVSLPTVNQVYIEETKRIKIRLNSKRAYDVNDSHRRP